MSKYLKILLFSLMAFMGCEDAVDGVDGEDYEKLYLQEFKKRKSENIISSGTLVGLATGLTVLLLFESFGGGMGGYDACFDPRCD